MKRKAVFLDRDGTINFDKGYVYKSDDFRYLDGVIEGLKKLQEAGFLLVVITNQSGIARGFYSEEDFLKLSAWMVNDLKKRGIQIEKTYYCPHHPEYGSDKYRMNCACRKPATGLFIKAIEEFDIDVSQSYVIGDKMRDLSICNIEKSIKGYLLYNEEKEIIDNITKLQGGLLEAAHCIVEDQKIHI